MHILTMVIIQRICTARLAVTRLKERVGLQVPSIVIGICGGVMGTVFTYLNLKITRFRNRFFVPYKIMRLLGMSFLLFITFC
jgi:H+/Cl- antiporter ClcA